MDIVAITIIIIAGVVLFLTFYVIGVYNNLLNYRNIVEDKFAQIDKELKKRTEAISLIVEIVKKYVKHEEKLLNEADKAIDKMSKANNINDKIKALNNINKVLNKINTLRESYPELKSSRKYSSIIKDLNDIEDKINYTKPFYNDAVSNYNKQRKEFPSSIIANIFKFKDIDTIK